VFRLGYVPIDVRIALRQALTDHADRMDQFIVVSPHAARVASAPDES
jgi:hypothetical protein